MHGIDIQSKFEQITAYWQPVIVAELNGQYVKLAKVKGEFIWHKHEAEDELFQVIKGELQMEFRNKTVVLSEGQMIVVPKGVEHRPVCLEETWILLFEPKQTLNTGDADSELTQENLEWL